MFLLSLGHLSASCLTNAKLSSYQDFLLCCCDVAKKDNLSFSHLSASFLINDKLSLLQAENSDNLDEGDEDTLSRTLSEGSFMSAMSEHEDFGLVNLHMQVNKHRIAQFLD